MLIMTIHCLSIKEKMETKIYKMIRMKMTHSKINKKLIQEV